MAFLFLCDILPFGKIWDSSGSSAEACSLYYEIATLFLCYSLVWIVSLGKRPVRLGLSAFSLNGSFIGMSSLP